MTNSELINSFYTAFANGDAAKMKACYADNIVFEDPAFGVLKGKEAGYMWQMLFERSQGELKVTFDNVTANEKTGTANWKAIYTYGDKKRNVINNVSAKFEFKDGKIIKHTDDFDLWKWTKQALGAPGYLLGWSSFMRNQIQGQTNKMLKKYIQKHS